MGILVCVFGIEAVITFFCTIYLIGLYYYVKINT